MLARLENSGTETVRVLFADQHGILRGKTLVASALRSAFANGVGVPSTLLLKDTSHRTVFPVWSDDPAVSPGPLHGANDVLLIPDANSFMPLPWAPHSAWLFADVVYRDGKPIPFAPRRVLQTAVDRLAKRGWRAFMGLEVEFHVFRRVDDRLSHDQTTMPGAPPETRALAHGFQYLTENRYDEVETVLDDIRRTAQAMNMPVRSVEIEMGPSQFEVTFDPAQPMAQADTMVMFRTMVKQVCARKGLHASFMAKPRLENISANGWHIHQSLVDADGSNLFMPGPGGTLPDVALGWIAGLLEHAGAASLLVSATVNSYKRYQPFQLAPNRVGWGEDNRGAMVRALMKPGDAASRVENRAPDSTANPYYAFASQIVAGLDGVENRMTPPPPTVSPYDAGMQALPGSLIEAIDAFSDSALFRTSLGDEFVDYLCKIKRHEWQRYLSAVSEWEQAEYFSLY